MVRGCQPALEERLAELVGVGPGAATGADLWRDPARRILRPLSGRRCGAGRDPPRLAARTRASARSASIACDNDPPEQLRLKIYKRGGLVPLSDVVPVLENFGFTVLKETPTVLPTASAPTSTNSRWSMADGSAAARLVERAAMIEEAIASVLRGEAENDAFNQLIIIAGLEPAGGGLAARLVPLHCARPGSLTRWSPWSTRWAARRPRPSALVDLFCALHDPVAARASARPRRSPRRRVRRCAARTCAAIDDDRILRLMRVGGRGDAAHQRLRPGGRRGAGVQDRFSSRCRGFPRRSRSAKSGSIRRASRASTCAAARSPAAGFAGPTGATISAPKSSA